MEQGISKRKRRSFTEDYRREAAALVIDTDRPIATVARELGLGEQCLGRWVAQERQRRSPEGESIKSLEELEAENKRLRLENINLKKDKEFLEKAAAFFASTHQNKNASS